MKRLAERAEHEERDVLDARSESNGGDGGVSEPAHNNLVREPETENQDEFEADGYGNAGHLATGSRGKIRCQFFKHAVSFSARLKLPL